MRRESELGLLLTIMDAATAVGVLGLLVAIGIGGWQIAIARRQRSPVFPVSYANAPPDSITRVSSRREVVPVEFMIQWTGERVILELPRDARVADLIPELARTLHLPLRYENGRDVPLEICSQDRGIALNGELTIRQNAVLPNEILVVRVVASTFG
ncbi:MAG: hypothetical protein HY534_06020 [Chloroflexi bacterium]|nr:hypothetical protein [Chloroflexota bacterium]